MTKTVLFVDHDPVRSGSTVSMEYIMRAFADAGYAVWVDTAKGESLSSAFVAEGYHVTQRGPRLVRSLGLDTLFSNRASLISARGLTTLVKDMIKFGIGLVHFWRVIRAHRPDLVYVNEHTIFSASVIARFLGVPSVIHVRSRLMEGVFGIRRSILCSLILLCNGRIFAITRLEAGPFLAEKRGIGKVLVVPEFVQPVEHAMREKVPGLNLSHRTTRHPLVVMLGGLQRVKGALVFLLAAEAVLRQRMDVDFVIAGSVEADGDRSERQHHAACQESIGRLEKTGRLSMLGAVPDPYPLLRESTIVVAPSIESHFSRPIIEAWSCGKPVIASSTTHHLDLVKDGRDGWLVRVNDHEDLAGRILSVLADPRACKRLGKAGEARARAEFDSETNTSAVILSCEELMARGRESRA